MHTFRDGEEDRGGGGIACIAMLTGQTYQRVKARLEASGIARNTNLDALGNGGGLTWGAIVIKW